MKETLIKDRIADLNDAQLDALFERVSSGMDLSTHRERKTLVAFVTSNNVASPDTNAVGNNLRQYLHSMLPDYMVPRQIEFLEDLPRTATGKINRQALPEPAPFLMLDDTRYVEPIGEIEQLLASIWSEVLGIDMVGTQDNYFEIGGDSILSIQIISRARQAGLRLKPLDIFEHSTITELAKVVQPDVQPSDVEEIVEGEVPLTPIQSWFFESHHEDVHHWNQWVLLQSEANFSMPAFKQALVDLIAQHAALRLCFKKTTEGWEQYCVDLEDSSVPVIHVDLSSAAPETVQQVQAQNIEEQQRQFDLAQAPLLRAIVFDRGHGQPTQIALLSHHLIVDVISWRILFEDLSVAYEAHRDGMQPAFPEVTSSINKWTTRLAKWAASDALKPHQAYWTHQVAANPFSIPVDHPDGKNTEALAATHRVKFSETTTHALLVDVPSVYNTQINDILLSALGLAIFKWTGERAIQVGLEGHGREALFDDVDLSRTVGWFTSFFPCYLMLPDEDSFGAVIKDVKEQLRSLPQKGLGYGVLRYLAPSDKVSAASLRDAPYPEILFNYLGRDQGATAQYTAFTLLKPPAGSYSKEQVRPFKLEINARIVEDCLGIDWTYGSEQFEEMTIKKIASLFVEQLEGLIAHCKSPGAGGFTPSDFPDADLDQAELEQFLNSLS